MSSQVIIGRDINMETHIKNLVCKSIQVIVESRLGIKTQTECNPLNSVNDSFYLQIEDHPAVTAEIKSALNLGPNVGILQRLPVSVEISVKTAEGDSMVLEVWSIDVTQPNGQSLDENKDVTDATKAAGLKGVSGNASNGINNAAPNEQKNTSMPQIIYNRMSMLLKSVITLSRTTPAYKLSRSQCADAFTIFYRVIADRPHLHVLGDGYKLVSIGTINTNVGTLKMELSYRTKMTISPTTAPVGPKKGETNTIMLKSDHFRPCDKASNSLTQNTGLNALAFGKKGFNGCNGTERKVIDIEKPMRAGAFVDSSSLKKYTEEECSLSETPPFEWLLRQKTRHASEGSGSLESLNRKSESPASSPLSGNSISNNNNNYSSNKVNGALTNHTGKNTSNLNNNHQPPSPTPSNVHASALSQSPLKALFMPTQRHGSAPNLPPSRNGSGRIRTHDDDNLLKEINFPFSSTSNNEELAKFFRDCNNAPELKSMAPQAGTDRGSCSAAAAFYIELKRELDNFEDKMVDIEKLHDSIFGSSSTGSRSSGGGLQMSN